MSDNEKTFEAFRIYEYLCNCMDDYKDKVISRFKKCDHYPYFQRLLVEDDKANKWMCLFYLRNKEQKKRGLYGTIAYTTYDVPRKHKEYDVNAGRGCIMFSPYNVKKLMSGSGDSHFTVVMDIVPHAFNRYTERYLKPLNKENIEWGLKLEDMLYRWMWVDVSADLTGDKNAERHVRGDAYPYDVLMRGGGMLRGQLSSELLIRFTTYVSPDMMFDEQLKKHDEMTKEYWRSIKNFNNKYKKH